MILSIGEILIDTFKKTEEGNTTCMHYAGGAPFNLAVNAKRCGGEVGFVGRVGKDEFGRIVTEQCLKAGLDYLYIESDPHRRTTQALVTLTDGERDFCFFRKDTADYHINVDAIDLDRYPNLSIIHLGTLMLSTAVGRAKARQIVTLARSAGVMLSCDFNLRLDLYEDIEEARHAYKYVVDHADIIKFSIDELLLYTGLDSVDAALEQLCNGQVNRLVVLTMGVDGSTCVYQGRKIYAPTTPITPVDTTGAGDAFFGAFLASIDGGEWTEEVLRKALEDGNRQGAAATQHIGAIVL